MEDYPGRKARTLRFTCGAPRSARVVGDGSRALFLRSDGPEDLVTALWMSVVTGNGGHREMLLADPRGLLPDPDGERVSPQERARRERAREGGRGIVSYDVDASGNRVVFVLDGHPFLACIGPDMTSAIRDLWRGPGVAGDGIAQSSLPSPVAALRISPDGRHALYATGRELVVVDVDEEGSALGWSVVMSLPEDAPATLVLGLPEFVAGEEMDRYDGFWWSPDSRHALVETFDSSAEPVWYLSDPANPDVAATPRRYPRALTRNARVRLSLLDLAPDSSGRCHPGRPKDVAWDHDGFEYLAAVSWRHGQDAVLLVQSRLQNRDQALAVRPDGSTTVLESHSNPRWLDLVAGTPAMTPDGRLVCAFNDMDADTNRLTVDGRAFTPAGWQVRRVLDVGDEDVLAVVQRTPDLAPDVPAVWRARADEHDARSLDVVRLDYAGNVLPVTGLPGVWTASRHGRGMVVSGSVMESAKREMIHVLVSDDSASSGRTSAGRGPTVATTFRASIRNVAEVPGFTPTTSFVRLGAHRLIAAITRPGEGSRFAGASRLPVLMRPYGGPGFQQAVFSQAYHWDSQWWADQGFLVVTADGRGTTGRGPRWDREIAGRMKHVTLADQIEAVKALPEVAREADLSRVAIIGWSYGGYLAALAVLDAPDVFHAACAGAPPADWTLYDTHYTERYLGLDPETYRRNGLLDDAPGLRRPLMIIHGFADDNVTIAHSLRLSQALMAAGRSHVFLPLTGITHMTNDPAVARSLLVLQRDFLYEALGMEDAPEARERTRPGAVVR